MWQDALCNQIKAEKMDKQEEKTEQAPTLTNKQKVFVNEYLKSFNATAAALAAGYSEKTAYSIGWENLRKPEIKNAITARLDEIHMSADEALKLLSDIARGDVGEAVNQFGAVDLAELHRLGKTRLIKKIRQKTVTKLAKSEDDEDVEIHDTEIEFYPADSALRDILKIHGKYKDDVNLNVDKPIIIEVVKSV